MNSQVNAQVAPRLCACGCGIEVTSTNKKVEFLPGHDARLKATLIQRVLVGTPEQAKVAREALVTRGWEQFLLSAKPRHNGPCLCGCGSTTRNGSRFLPGHDATHKSNLIQKALKADADAIQAISDLGWTSFLQAAQLRIKEQADLKAKKQQATAKAIQTPGPSAPAPKAPTNPAEKAKQDVNDAAQAILDIAKRTNK